MDRTEEDGQTASDRKVGHVNEGHTALVSAPAADTNRAIAINRAMATSQEIGIAPAGAVTGHEMVKNPGSDRAPKMVTNPEKVATNPGKVVINPGMKTGHVIQKMGSSLVKDDQMAQGHQVAGL